VALFGFEWALGGGGFQPLLTLDCAPGTSFRMEQSSDLLSSDWSLLAPLTLNANRLFFVDESAANHAARF